MRGMTTDTQTSSAYVRMGVAAQKLGVSVDTLRGWCDEGRVDHYRTPKGERRISADAVDALIAMSAVPAAAVS